MSSFFQPDEEKEAQAPQIGDVSTRGQFTPPTGASTPGTLQKANTGTAVQGGGKAPAWTNLKSFLGAQDQGQRSAVAGKVTDEATKNATGAQAAGDKTAGTTGAQIQAGTNKGGVFGTSPSSTPAAPQVYADPTVAYAQNHETYTGPNLLGAKPDAQPNDGEHGSAPSAPPAGPPTPGGVNLDTVNLAGYQGPSAGAVASSFDTAKGLATKAADHANAGRNGKVAANAYDNAVATQTPAWASIRSALGGEQQAADRVNAQAAGGQEAVNQAQVASGNNVAKQKADLTSVNADTAKKASTQATVIKQVGAGLAKGDLQSVYTAMNNPAALQALGLSRDQLQGIATNLENGSLKPEQVAAYLKPYADNAANATGFDKTGADQTNHINDLLNNGAAAATANPAAISSKAPAQLDDEKNADAATIRSANGNVNSPAVKQAMQDLALKGYTREQIYAMVFPGQRPKG